MRQKSWLRFGCCSLVIWTMLLLAPISVLSDDSQPLITPGNARDVFALATISHGNIYDAAWIPTPLGDRLVVIGADGILLYYMDRLNERPYHQVKDNIAMPVKVAVSPDGRQIATGHEGGAIILWEQLTFMSVELQGHTGTINALAFSPDGERLFSASRDGTAVVWDISERADGVVNALYTLEGHDPYPLALAFSPDGKLLATAGGNPGALGMLPGTTDTVIRTDESSAKISAIVSDSVVRLWDIETGKSVRVLHGSDYAITSLMFDSEGGRLFAQSIDKRILIWNVEDSALLETIEPDESIGSIFAFALSPDESYLILSAQSTTPGLWKYDFQSHEFTPIPTTIRRNTTTIFKLFYSPDHSTLVAVHLNNVDFYGLDTFEHQSDLPLHHFYAGTFPGGSSHPTFSLHGKSLALYDYTTNDVVIWDTDLRQEAFRLTDFDRNNPVYSIAFSDDATQLATGSYDGDIQVWDLRTKQPVAALNGHIIRPALLTFSPNGHWLASATSDFAYQNYVVRLWSLDSKTGYELRVYTPESIFFYISALTFSPDSRVLAVRDATMTSHFYEVTTQTELSEVQFESSYVSAEADAFPTPFQREIYLANLGNRYRENGILKDDVLAGLIPKHVTWSQSGYVSLSDIGQIGDVTITQMETNTPIVILRGHTGPVPQTSFSPDGRLVITAGGDDRGTDQDDTLRIWHTPTGEQLKEFDLSLSNMGISDKLVFSPDGRYFVTATYDDVIRLWGVWE